MNIEKYKKICKKNTPKENNLKKLLVSFIVGGLIGVLGQFLMDFYSSFQSISKNDAGNLMMVTLIFFSCLFTALGFFDDLVTKIGAGLFVPITGFAHATTSSAMEYRKEGLVFGIGSNIFKMSGSVILYGIISAYVCSILSYIFGG